MLATEAPFPQFFDTNGSPLSRGSLYFGVANLNPETNPITVYWDSAGTQPAAQPIQTLNGYAVRNGTPAIVYAVGDYSLNVRNGRGNLVYYLASAAAGSNSLLLQAAIASNAASLLSSIGATLVGWIQSGASAILRLVQDKLRESVSVKDFGAVGDGTTDDTTAFLAACAEIVARGGGTVRFFDKHLIDTNLVVPDFVRIQGPLGNPGELLPGSTANYGAKSGLLILNSAATITLGDGAMVCNCMVIRKGLTLPFADATAAANGIAAFAGTAFTVGGADASLERVLVLGFNKLLTSTGFERVRASFVSGDNNNGIEIINCADISYMRECHMWPWTTVHQSWTTNALMRRPGFAYKFTTLGDWNKVSQCFSYGYFRGFWASSVNSMTFDGCGADNTATAGVGDYAGALGFVVDGTSQDTRFSLCQAAAQATGYYIAPSAGLHTRLLGCDSWACSSGGVDIVTGDVTIIGGTLRNTVNGVSVESGTSVVLVDGVRFAGISTAPIAVNAANSSVTIGKNNDYGDWAAGTSVTNNANKVQRSVTAADPLNLPVNGEYFQVTGNTNFGTLNGGWAGRIVYLKFTGTPTLSDGGASMKLAGNFVATADDTLTLIHDGTAWYELARSVN